MPDHPVLTFRRVAVGIALTAVGGFVDCFSYLTLSNVYTATMSGNTVLIAVHGGRGETMPAAIHAFTVAVFVLGLLASSIAIELGLRRGVRRVLALAMALEAACLAVLAVWGAGLAPHALESSANEPHWPLYALIGVTAIAMGIQNTSLRMAGILAIFTTHVTGTLTRFCEQLVNYLFTRSGAQSAATLGQARLSAGLWVAFFGGALLASELIPRWGSGRVLLLPIATLVVVIAADLRRPFASAAASGEPSPAEHERGR